MRRNQNDKRITSVRLNIPHLQKRIRHKIDDMAEKQKSPKARAFPFDNFANRLLLYSYSDLRNRSSLLGIIGTNTGKEIINSNTNSIVPRIQIHSIHLFINSSSRCILREILLQSSCHLQILGNNQTQRLFQIVWLAILCSYQEHTEDQVQNQDSFQNIYQHYRLLTHSDVC